MHALVVLSHPDPASLTHAVAEEISKGIHAADPAHSTEIADLAAEGFDPRFNVTDLAMFRKEIPLAGDVAAEQARIDRADALVLVYPIYWWSMPGLLKGWIDRVFTNGWAYDENPSMKMVKKLQHLPVHLVAIGGADMRTYARHGYFGAMKTQIDHGIFDFCGASVITSELLVGEPRANLEDAYAIGGKIFAASRQSAAA